MAEIRMAETPNSNVGWGLMLQGMLTLLFGIAAVFWPDITLVTLVYLFSAFVLTSGVIALFEGIKSIGHEGTWWFLGILLGIFQVGVGVYLLRHVDVSFKLLILLIGFTFIIKGLINLVGSFFNDSLNSSGRTLMGIGGFISLLAGVIILFQPVASGVTFVWILGVYALIAGPLELAMASDIRKMEKEYEM